MNGTWGRKILGLVSVVLLGAGAWFTGVSAAGAAQRTGQVFVIHAIVGATADVLIDGHTVASNAVAKTVVGPMQLATGEHVVALKQGASTLISARFTVRAGVSTDVVAHRTAAANPMPVVTVFRNDLGPVPPGKTRLVVSHVAVAPPADIRVNGKPLFRNVANGESLALVVPAKTYSVDIVPTAGSGAAILAPVRLTLKAGTLTRVFAIGDPTAHTMDAVVQLLSVSTVGASRPSSVPTGDGGQAAESFVGSGTGPAPWALTCLVLGMAGLLATRRWPGGGHARVGRRHVR